MVLYYRITSLAIIIAGMLELIFGYFQLFSQLNNYPHLYISGSFMNPGPYAGFIVIPAIFAFYEIVDFIFPEKKQVSNKTYTKIITITITCISFCYLIGIATILPFTNSRTAWIAAIIGCGVVIFRKDNVKCFVIRLFTRSRVVFIAFVCTILLSVFLACNYLYSYKKDSADGRMLIWKISCLTINNNYWGTGSGSFAGQYGVTQADYFKNHNSSERERYLAGSPKYAYNEFIQMGVEYGIFGLDVFLLVVIYALYNIQKSKVIGSTPIMGSYVCILLLCLFSYPFRVYELSLLSCSIIILALLWPRNYKQRFSPIKIFIFFSLILTTIIVSYSFEKIGHRAKNQAIYHWQQTRLFFNSGNYDQIVDIYGQLYPYLCDEPVFLFEYGQCLSKTGQFLESNQILQYGIKRSSDPMFLNIMGINFQALKEYGKAEDCFHQAMWMVPNRIYPLYLRMKLYIEIGEVEKAVDLGQQILNKKSKVDSDLTIYIKEQSKQLYKELMEFSVEDKN